jgi:hypothetical protein
MLGSSKLKGPPLKTKLTVLAVALLASLAGCNGAVEVPKVPALPEGKELFTVEFQQGRTLRYKFVSKRKIRLDWGHEQEKAGRRGGRGAPSKEPTDMSESMSLVVAYTPVKANAYGLTTVRATCEAVEVRRSKGKSRSARNSKDAVKSLAGKTFTFTIRPDGRIDDRSQLDQLIREIGQKVFRQTAREARIKEPDMIGDFVATQWFLWDSVSSIESPIEGIAVGQSWQSVLSVPSPMVMRKARDVTYTLKEVRESDKGRIAVIGSSYSHAESVPDGWPVPYMGSFQVSGPFGLLRRFQIEELNGSGQELFNITAGRAEHYKQDYHMEVSAGLMWPLPGVKPKITIDQTLTMQLLEN